VLVAAERAVVLQQVLVQELLHVGGALVERRAGEHRGQVPELGAARPDAVERVGVVDAEVEPVAQPAEQARLAERRPDHRVGAAAVVVLLEHRHGIGAVVGHRVAAVAVAAGVGRVAHRDHREERDHVDQRRSRPAEDAVREIGLVALRQRERLAHGEAAARGLAVDAQVVAAEAGVDQRALLVEHRPAEQVVGRRRAARRGEVVVLDRAGPEHRVLPVGAGARQRLQAGGHRELLVRAPLRVRVGVGLEEHALELGRARQRDALRHLLHAGERAERELVLPRLAAPRGDHHHTVRRLRAVLRRRRGVLEDLDRRDVFGLRFGFCCPTYIPSTT
jgi:hypothetical protein